MLHFELSQLSHVISDVQEGDGLSLVSMNFSRSVQDLSQLETPSSFRPSNTLELASFLSTPDSGSTNRVAWNDGVIPIQPVSIVDGAFDNVDSWGARAIARAEHGEKVPPKGAVDWTKFDHRDPGDSSRWNRGYCSTLADSPEAGNQKCLQDNRTDAKTAMQKFAEAGIPDPGPVALINLVDLYNQRPVAAPHYAKWVIKLLKEGKSAQEAILEARVEAYRKDGSGEYITGGPINPQTGKPEWPGLGGICKTSSAYDYIEKEMGLAEGSQPWLRQCILHNQKQRWERINLALENHGKLQYGSLANVSTSGSPPAASSPAQSNNGGALTTQPTEGARAPAVQFDIKNIPGGWVSWVGLGLILWGAWGWWNSSRHEESRGRFYSDDGMSPREYRRYQNQQRARSFADKLRNKKGPFR